MRHVNRGLVVSSAVALLLVGCADDPGDDSAITQESTEAVTDDAAIQDDNVPGEATWTRVFTGESFGSSDVEGGGLSGVAITESGFVAVGVAERSAAVWTSTDGVQWTLTTQVSQTDPPEFSGGIALADDGHLAMAARGAFGAGEVAVWASHDGRDWNRVAGGAAVFGDDSNVADVTQGGPGWVAVGNSWDPNGPASSAVVWTADEEDSWTRVPHDDAIFGDAVMIGVVAGDEGLLAFGHNGGPRPVVWTSPNGVSWTRAPLDEAPFDDALPTPGANAVIAGGPGWVAVGSTIDRSPDGFDWTGGPAAWTSPDGVAWTRLPDDAFVGGPTEPLVAVTTASSQLVAVGDGGSLWTSTDGTTWTNIPHQADEEPAEEPQFGAVVADGTKVIVVGSVLGDSGEARPAVWNATLPD